MEEKLDKRPKMGTPSARKRWASLALAVVFFSTAVAPAQADYYSGGMPSVKFNVKYVSVNSTWTGYFDQARTRWINTSGTGVSIGVSSSAKATMTAAQYSESWYGLYDPSGLRNINRVFSIKVNARTISNAAGSDFAKWATGTATHELGHALSLDDNPNTTAVSLMKHNRNRSVTIYPTAYDISEVKRIY